MSSRSNDVSSPIREDSAQFDPLSPSPSKTKKPMMQRAMRKVYKSFTAPEKDADGQRISLSRSLSKRFGRRESGASSQTLDFEGDMAQTAPLPGAQAGASPPTTPLKQVSSDTAARKSPGSGRFTFFPSSKSPRTDGAAGASASHTAPLATPGGTSAFVGPVDADATPERPAKPAERRHLWSPGSRPSGSNDAATSPPSMPSLGEKRPYDGPIEDEQSSKRGPGGDATAASAGKDVEAPGGSSTPRSRGPHASEAAARAAAIARSGGGGGGDVAGDLGDFGARVEAGEHAADFQFRASEGGRKAGEAAHASTGLPPQPPFQSLAAPADAQPQGAGGAFHKPVVAGAGAAEGAADSPAATASEPVVVGEEPPGPAADQPTSIPPADVGAGTPFEEQQPRVAPVKGVEAPQAATFNSFDSPVSSALGIPGVSGYMQPSALAHLAADKSPSGLGGSVDLAAGLRAGGGSTQPLDSMPTPSLGAPSSVGDEASRVELAPQQPRAATPMDEPGDADVADGRGAPGESEAPPSMRYSTKSTAGSTIPLSVDVSDEGADDADAVVASDAQSPVAEQREGTEAQGGAIAPGDATSYGAPARVAESGPAQDGATGLTISGEDTAAQHDNTPQSVVHRSTAHAQAINSADAPQWAPDASRKSFEGAPAAPTEVGPQASTHNTPMRSSTALPEEQAAPEHSTPSMYDGVTQRVSPYTQMDDPYASQPASAHETPEASGRASGVALARAQQPEAAQEAEDSPKALQQMPLARDVLGVADERVDFRVRAPSVLGSGEGAPGGGDSIAAGSGASAEEVAATAPAEQARGAGGAAVQLGHGAGTDTAPGVPAQPKTDKRKGGGRFWTRAALVFAAAAGAAVVVKRAK